jgi:hypothetical protein
MAAVKKLAVRTAVEPTAKRSLPAAKDMTPEQVSLALKNAAAIEAWIRAVRAHAHEILRSGGKIPGFMLGYGVRQRIWRPKSERALLAKLARKGITKDQVYTKPELLSPAQLEKLLKEQGLWPAKPRNGERPPSIMDEFVEQSMPEKKIVPIKTDDSGKLIEADEAFG